MLDETQQPASAQNQPEPISTTPIENPISEPNPVPVSPDEPKAGTSIPPIESVPAPEPLGPTEATPSPESAILDKDQNPANEPFDEAQDKPSEPAPNEPNNSSSAQGSGETKPNVTVEKHGNDITITEVMEPTAQMAGNEPLAVKRKENLERANLKRQTRKRERINDILDLFAERQKVTNDEVEKLLHVSDATATRYLETLEKEGKIKQVGKTGKGVSYIPLR